MPIRRRAVLLASLIILPACQSTNQAAGPAGAAAPAATASAAAPAAGTGPATAPTAIASAAPAARLEATRTGFAAASAASPAQCAIAFASGPPPKPSRGADFGSAAAKNVGKGLGRSLISGIGGAVAGPLGGVIAGGLATNAIRSEQDLKGSWTATDGSPTCGCTLAISASTNLQLKTANRGKIAPQSCSNPQLARAATWTLADTFTGYDAAFQLQAADGSTVATLNREGVDYFSGSLADGTPVTIWRD